MDLAQFPLRSLLMLSGPEHPPFPPDPAEDYESWEAQLDEHTWVRVPLLVIHEMTTPHPSGRLWEVNFGDATLDERKAMVAVEMERCRNELNAAAARVEERNTRSS